MKTAHFSSSVSSGFVARIALAIVLSFSLLFTAQHALADSMAQVKERGTLRVAVSLFHPPLLAARSKLGKGKIIVPTPALSQPSSVAVRTEDATDFVEWVDESIAEYYNAGQTQQWYEEALAEFGLDGSTAPPVMIEMLEQ